MEWSAVVNNPILKDLPFKIERNKFGKILMSPTSNQHGRIQSRMAANLINKLPSGEVITECSIQTSDGVKVADVAWASDVFIQSFAYTSRGHGCGIYSELMFVESKALKQAHSWLCNCFSNAAIGNNQPIENRNRDRAKYTNASTQRLTERLYRDRLAGRQ